MTGSDACGDVNSVTRDYLLEEVEKLFLNKVIWPTVVATEDL